jgi:tetratricopeptide (TPR) repeat protein
MRWLLTVLTVTTLAYGDEVLATLKRLAAEQSATAKDAAAFYQAAKTQFFTAEVALEKRDKATSGAAAEAGIALAKKAVTSQPNNSEFHRLLGSLCGQSIPANLFLAMKYGRCALDEVEKAVSLDPKSAINYVSRGVGNYYLPAQFGGSLEKALQDFDKAIQLDAKLSEAFLWKGIALRKANRIREAQDALSKAVQLNPERSWAQEQLAKTKAAAQPN